MSRVSLKPEASASKQFWKLAMDLGDSYRIHRAVWSLFAKDPEKKRDFLYRQDEKNGLPSFYIVSEDVPENNSDLWDIEPKSIILLFFRTKTRFFIARQSYCNKMGGG